MDNTLFSQFSVAEQNYAISQLDPFHDVPYRLTGAPSDQNTESIVMIVNREMVVDASDFGISTAAGVKWDLHVTALPLLNQASFYTGFLSSSSRISCSGTVTESGYKQLYPISIHGVLNGSGTFLDNQGSTQTAAILGLDNTVSGYLSGPASTVFVPRKMRVIGNSFEVVDESPTLYQQGSVTVYQVPSNCQESTAWGVRAVAAGAVNQSDKSLMLDIFNGPPNYLAEATILPNSKTWKAKEGAYVISRKSVDCVPFKRPGCSSQALISAPDRYNTAIRNCFVSREWYNASFESSDPNFFDSFNMLTYHNTCGAYFSGLNAEFGAFRIRWKAIYEILPDPDDESLIPLVTPTLPRNPVFERLLDESVSRLPPGVPQTSNPKGEFWKTVLGIVKKVAQGTAKVAPVVSAVTGLPVAPITGVAEGVSNVISEIENLKKSKKKKKKSNSTMKKQQTKPA